MSAYLSKAFVTEGKNEVLYFQKNIVNLCTVKFNKMNEEEGKRTVSIIVGNAMTQFHSRIEDPYCKNILIANGGLDTIIHHLMPTLINSCVRNFDTFNFTIVFDSDNQSDRTIKDFERIVIQTLNRISTNLKYSLYPKDESYLFECKLNDREKRQVYVKICFVPKSFEFQIVKKWLEKNKDVFGVKKCRELESLDPHAAIIEISKLLKGKDYRYDQDDRYSIALAGEQNLFIDEEWYQNIMENI